jgi:hypothetical protein
LSAALAGHGEHHDGFRDRRDERECLPQMPLHGARGAAKVADRNVLAEIEGEVAARAVQVENAPRTRVALQDACCFFFDLLLRALGTEASAR